VHEKGVFNELLVPLLPSEVQGELRSLFSADRDNFCCGSMISIVEEGHDGGRPESPVPFQPIVRSCHTEGTNNIF